MMKTMRMRMRMSWKTDAMLLGGLAVGAYALVTYVFPKSAAGLNQAIIGSAETIGSAVGAGAGNVIVSAATPVVQSFNPFNPHAVQNEPLYQAGAALANWQKSLPWILQPGIVHIVQLGQI